MLLAQLAELKLTVRRNSDPTLLSVRDIGPSRCKCCDDECIFLRQEVMQTDCSELDGCPQLTHEIGSNICRHISEIPGSTGA